MNEDFLHYVWRYNLLPVDLYTTMGEALQVQHPGAYNRDSGPDFFNARIRIGDTVWAGNVEIHLKASDWFRHNHQDDPAYDNVILHVVDTFDAEVIGKNGMPVPAVEIRGKYPGHLARTWEYLAYSNRWIPCSELLEEHDIDTFTLWTPALAIERLEYQSARIRQVLRYCKGDWEEAFYCTLARAMGFRTNAEPFELLARSTPLGLLLKYRDNPEIVESILLGQAGLLNANPGEVQSARWRDKYNFYKMKHSLTSLNPGVWKFLRMRPNNFPTIRISQFASLLCNREILFEGFSKNAGSRKWIDLLTVAASSFWDSHYTFDKVSPHQPKILGEQSAQLIVINAVIPFLYLNGAVRHQPEWKERALSLLEEIPGERSSIINTWESMGMDVSNAMNTQALKQLKSDYCDGKRCLECRIGSSVLKRGIIR